LFLDPERLNEHTPAEILDAAAHGHLGLDHRFLRALLDRPEDAQAAALAFSKGDRSHDVVDITPELIALFRHWRTPTSIPFLIDYIKEDPTELPDEVVETLVAFGGEALERLLALYNELDESHSGEVAFILANLGVRDERILKILTDRLAFDLPDTALLLENYGDAAAIPALRSALAELGSEDGDLRKEIEAVIASLETPRPPSTTEEADTFDIWRLLPEKEDLPVDLLDEDERVELLSHPVAAVRASAVHSFFNQELSREQERRILNMAQHDPDVEVRGRAWQSLINSTENEPVLDAMLNALRNPETPLTERAGLLIGLAPEADRNEVRDAILALYQEPQARAKALEAMWRSMHPGFRDHFAKHLDDADLETRRGAIWGVGYYGVRSELSKLRELFDNEELRSDALFAYALTLPGDTSRARIKGLLSRIEKDAKGLSEMEEELVRAALDERLLLAGKEPVFRGEED
jgi:hypothetical protein